MITAPVTKSAPMERSNTLKQFDGREVVGLDTAVGRIPILFYVQHRCENGVRSGVRGILFGGDDFTDLCFMYPESEHAEWCQNRYAMKYDDIETYYNQDLDETTFERKHGILDMTVDYERHYYNGQIMYNPEYKVKGTTYSDSYSVHKKEPVIEETSVTQKTNKTKKGTPTVCASCQRRAV